MAKSLPKFLTKLLQPDGVTTPSKASLRSQIEATRGKKDGLILVNKPPQLKMFPQFYQTHLQQQLKNTEYLTLKILVYLLQVVLHSNAKEL